MHTKNASPDRYLELQCIVVRQPIGDFYICAMRAADVAAISFFDVRQKIVAIDDDERYLGIQRELSPKRVTEIKRYVSNPDATFPTSIILAVDENCVEIKQAHEHGLVILRLSAFLGDADLDLPETPFDSIARVIDGQHRIAGLEDFDDRKSDFELTVSIFVGADLSDQANIFSTVNLAQTKVNRSLGLDLFELAKVRSPQKTCHNVTIALDRDESGPFGSRIKRLGVATIGRRGETLTQATFVDSLMPFISSEPAKDRAAFLKGKPPGLISHEALSKLPFRNMFLTERDLEIASILRNYFVAVDKRWEVAWRENRPGWILNRTNGFRALMRLLLWLYPRICEPGEVPKASAYKNVFEMIDVDDSFFHRDNFEPGGGGELRLYRFFRDNIDV